MRRMARSRTRIETQIRLPRSARRAGDCVAGHRCAPIGLDPHVEDPGNPATPASTFTTHVVGAGQQVVVGSEVSLAVAGNP